jgi:NADPH-dependent ferric siderophore reductase
MDVDSALAALAPELLPSLNTDYEDSLVFVARVLAGRRSATAARVTALDRNGADLLVTDPTGEHQERLVYANPIDDPTELTTELFGLVVRAREVSGEEGTTSAERVMAEMRGIRTFVTEVAAVEDVHPHLRRITFAGGDLAGFAPLGPDTFLYLLLPPPGRTELTVDQSFSWETVGDMPEGDQPVGAYYTVRAWRPERAEIDMLFVLHGDVGPASAWAHRARPGDPVALWGPRSAYHPPPETDWHLLVADETGLPAIGAICESLPPGAKVQAIVEVTDEYDELPLDCAADVDVRWIHRGSAAVGTTTLLVDAIRELAFPEGEQVYAWGAGEIRAMNELRDHLRRTRGLAKHQVSVLGYWRHSNHAEEDKAGSDD